MIKLFKKVDNDNNLKNIIDKIEFNYNNSENQENLFTSNYIKYDVSITYKQRTFTTTYQIETAYQTAQDVKKDDVIYCIFSDMAAYDSTRDIDDFANEFGYNNEKAIKVLRIYNACKDTSNILHKIFTNEEIEEIQKELEERGF